MSGHDQENNEPKGRLLETESCVECTNDEELSHYANQAKVMEKTPVKLINAKYLSASSPRKKLVTALKDKIAEENKMSNMAFAHEVALNDNFKLPYPSESTPMSSSDDAKESERKKFENTVKKVVHKAFWDSLQAGIESDPPNYEHAFILLREIKGILLSLLPSNRKTSLHHRIETMMDIDLLEQQAKYEAVDVRSVADFIISTMTMICAPARDEEVAALKHYEDTVDVFQNIYTVLDNMKIDLANFAIQSIRPLIQQQQFEYERSTFAKLVQSSSDRLKNTRHWILKTYEEIKVNQEKIKEKEALHNVTMGRCDADVNQNKESSISPVDILKTAYTRLLTWDYTKDNFPETLSLDKKRFQTLQYQVEQLVIVASSMITICGVFGQPLASHQAFLSQLKDVLLVLTDSKLNVEEKLEAISLQIWVEAVKYTKGKGEEVEKCISNEKESLLKSKIMALSAFQSHPVYNILYKRTIEYFKVTADILASHSSVTPPTLPTPPAGILFIATELIALSLQYAKLVNLNQTVYGPFYVPIMRELFGIPQYKSDSTATVQSASVTVRKKLNMSDEEKSEFNDSEKSESKKPTYKVTGSLEDLD